MRVTSGSITNPGNATNGAMQAATVPTPTTISQESSHIVTQSKSDLWAELEASLRLLVGVDGKSDRQVIVSPQSGVIVVRGLPRELERINRRLETEATERLEAQRQLNEVNHTLEQRVKARTRELLERTVVLEEAREQLRASAAKFQGLADAAPGFIWSTDHEGHCTFMSARFESFTGLAESYRSAGRLRRSPYHRGS